MYQTSEPRDMSPRMYSILDSEIYDDARLVKPYDGRPRMMLCEARILKCMLLNSIRILIAGMFQNNLTYPMSSEAFRGRSCRKILLFWTTRNFTIVEQNELVPGCAANPSK